jgi:hypothetical protein
MRSDEPLVVYLVLFGVSLGAAVLFYFLGGSVAEVSGNSESILGVGFQVTGAAAIFIVFFLMSDRTVKKLTRRAPMDLSVRLKGKPKRLSKGQSYRARYHVDGDEWTDVEPRWDGEFLVLDLRRVPSDRKIKAKVENDEGQAWLVDAFFIHEPIREARVDVTVTTWAQSQTRESRPSDRPAAPTGLHVSAKGEWTSVDHRLNRLPSALVPANLRRNINSPSPTSLSKNLDKH